MTTYKNPNFSAPANFPWAAWRLVSTGHKYQSRRRNKMENSKYLGQSSFLVTGTEKIFPLRRFQVRVKTVTYFTKISKGKASLFPQIPIVLSIIDKYQLLSFTRSGLSWSPGTCWYFIPIPVVILGTNLRRSPEDTLLMSMFFFRYGLSSYPPLPFLISRRYRPCHICQLELVTGNISGIERMKFANSL